MILSRARDGAVAKRPYVVRHEFLPAQAGCVEPAALEAAMEDVHVSMWRALAIGRLRGLAVWPAIPVHLGVKPVQTLMSALAKIWSEVPSFIWPLFRNGPP